MFIAEIQQKDYSDFQNYFFLNFQYADPVADLLDKWGVFRSRLFRESCVFYRGNYVKVSFCMINITYNDRMCV